MSDDLLFREVDEELRREELESIWKKYGTYILAVCLGIIMTVGGVKGWQYYQKQQAEAGGVAYYNAVELAEAGKTDDALKAFENLKKSHAGFALFGRFKQAGLLVEKGDKKAAIAVYDALASDKSVEAGLQELAKIKAAYLLVDTASLQDVQKRVAAFDTKTGNWRNQAKEIIAIAAYRAGDYQLADRKLNEILADFKSSAGARQRARLLLSVLAPILDAKKKNTN